MVRIHADTTTKLGAVRLHVQGQLDLNAASAFDKALARAARLQRPVEIDLGEIDFIDGSGLSMLIDAKSRAHCAGHELMIIDASRCVYRLIEITHTADSLPPFSTHRESPDAKAEGATAGRAPENAGMPAFRA